MPAPSTKRRKAAKQRVLLGHGSFGCAFAPAVPCAQEDGEPAAVGKLVSDPREVSRELTIAKRLLEIDPFQDFTNPAVRFCKVDPARASAEVLSCKLHSALRGDLSNQLLYKLEGVPLHDIRSKRGVDLFAPKYFDGWLHLAKGIRLLRSHGIAHMDLSARNLILVGKRIVMIDFGFSRSFQAMYSSAEDFQWMRAKHPNMPPEIKLHLVWAENQAVRKHFGIEPTPDGALSAGVSALFGFRRSFGHAVEALRELGITEATFREQMDEACEDFLAEYRGVRHTYDTQDALHRALEIPIDADPMPSSDLMRKHAEKYDVYSLGVCMLKLFHENGYLTQRRPTNFVVYMKMLLASCVHANPRRRCSIDDVIHLLTTISESHLRPQGELVQQ